MAVPAKFCAAATALLSTLFFTSFHLFAAGEPSIPASPAVLPYVNAPNMSSFFPSPTREWPAGSAAPPYSDAFAPAPTSGEFVGTSLSSPGRLASGSVIMFIQLCAWVVLLFFCYC